MNYTPNLFLERWIVERWIVCKTRKVPRTKWENKFGFPDNLNYKVYLKKNERLVKPDQKCTIKNSHGKILACTLLHGISCQAYQNTPILRF